MSPHLPTVQILNATRMQRGNLIKQNIDSSKESLWTDKRKMTIQRVCLLTLKNLFPSIANEFYSSTLALWQKELRRSYVTLLLLVNILLLSLPGLNTQPIAVRRKTATSSNCPFQTKKNGRFDNKCYF